jgi:hypothetical protein
MTGALKPTGIKLANKTFRSVILGLMRRVRVEKITSHSKLLEDFSL